ncbi:hypothetical protein B9W64_24590 [Streptomyces sp. CS159]|nr:hypothetical protein B9W64_24590 [Streptomyces sp. CS159]
MLAPGAVTCPGARGTARPATTAPHSPRDLNHPIPSAPREAVAQPGADGVPPRPPVPPQRHDCPQRRVRRLSP